MESEAHSLRTHLAEPSGIASKSALADATACASGYGLLSNSAKGVQSVVSAAHFAFALARRAACLLLGGMAWCRQRDGGDR